MQSSRSPKDLVKPGSICLSPAAPISEKEYVLLRAPLLPEISAVQLLGLLPRLEGDEPASHPIQTRVAAALNLTPRDLVAVINQVLQDQKMLKPEAKTASQSTEDLGVIMVPKEAHGAIRMVEMDEHARALYTLHGHCGVDELKSCKSVEINTLDYFHYVASILNESRKRLQACQNPGEREALAQVDYSLRVLRKMIRREKTRLGITGEEKGEKYYSDRDDMRSIYCEMPGGEWTPFVKGILESVANRTKERYPVATLNKDNSISISLHFCETLGCPSCKESVPFGMKFYQRDIVKQLEFFRQAKGLPLVDPGAPLVEVKNLNKIGEVLEFRINLSPENLDALLKLTSEYGGYRGANSVLDLSKQAKVKPGVICLSPLLPLNEKEYFLRAAGCQLFETTGLQLLQLLPDFKGVIVDFHHVPKIVEDAISVSSFTCTVVLNELLQEHRMIGKDENVNVETATSFQLLSAPSGEHPRIKVVEMDALSRDIYLKFGNCDAPELTACKSLEISLLDYLNYLVNNLKARRADCEAKKEEEFYAKQIPKLDSSLAVLAEMIHRETRRLAEASAPGHTAPHASFHHQPEGKGETPAPHPADEKSRREEP